MNPTPLPAAPPRGWLLFILIPALIAGAVFMVIQAVRTGPAGDVDRDLVAVYVGLIAEARYEEAYDRCLSAACRRHLSKEDFAGAHRRLRAERGPLKNREILLQKPSRNLFSGIREIQLLYRLEYEKGEWRNYLVASDADGEWRIDGTYRRATQYLEDFIW
jgi:hypothetical protein